MKKRLVTLMAAMVLTLSMGMTAFAKESPQLPSGVDTPGTGDVDIPSGYVDSATTIIDGQSVELVVEPNSTVVYANANAAQKAALDAIGFNAENETIGMNLIADLIAKVGGYTYTSAPYRDWFDLSLPAGQTIPAGGIKVTLETASVQAGDVVVVLHLNAQGQWENIPVEVKDGEIIGTFTSFSPVFVFVLENAQKVTAASSTTTGTAATTATKTATTTTAPKTGEFAGIYVAGMFALISAAGIVVYTKRQKTVR